MTPNDPVGERCALLGRKVRRGQLIIPARAVLAWRGVSPAGWNAGQPKENNMSEEVTGTEARKNGIEGAADKARKFAGAAIDNVKQFVKSLGAKIARLFKGSK